MKAQLLSTIEKSKVYTLAVAEAMPPEHFAFKPTPAVWTFLELMNHLAYGIMWWKENYIQKVKTSWEPPAPYKTKGETIQYLEQSFSSLQEILSNIDLDEEIIYGVFATLDHITHHRGQATIYLRCMSIAPTEYIF